MGSERLGKNHAFAKFRDVFERSNVERASLAREKCKLVAWALRLDGSGIISLPRTSCDLIPHCLLMASWFLSAQSNLPSNPDDEDKNQAFWTNALQPDHVADLIHSAPSSQDIA